MLKLYIYNVEVLYLNRWARVIKMLDVLEKQKYSISDLILLRKFEEVL